MRPTKDEAGAAFSANRFAPYVPPSSLIFAPAETALPVSALAALGSSVISFPGVSATMPTLKLSVYLLNPHAQNPEAAIAYLEYVAAHRDPGDEGLMKPNMAKPVLHPAVQEELDWRWETASSAQQAELRAYEAAVRAAPDSWAITEYRLNVYQQMIAPYLDLRLHPLLSASAKQEGGTYKLLLEILPDYVEGNKTLDECLNALQKAATKDL